MFNLTSRNFLNKSVLEAIYRSQAVIEFDTDGIILEANENFLNTMGYSRQEVVGNHHKMFVSPEYSKSPDYKEFWKRLREGEFTVSEFKRYGKEGREIWIQASYNPIFDENGKVKKVIKFATDITSQKIIHADSKAKTEAIYRSLAVIEFDLDGIILEANENFLNVMGYSREEVVGKHHRIFVSPVFAESTEYQEFWKKLRSGEYQISEYKRYGKNGKEVWIQASYNPVFDPEGKPVKVIKFATDITL